MLWSKLLEPRFSSRVLYVPMSPECHAHLSITDWIKNAIIAVEDKPKPSKTMELFWHLELLICNK